MSAYDELVGRLGAAAVTWQETAHELLAQLTTSEAARQSAEAKLAEAVALMRSLVSCDDMDVFGDVVEAAADSPLGKCRLFLAALDTEKAGG